MDILFSWIVIVLPFAISIIFIFIPARQENEKVHMKWRLGLVVIGIIFSGITWFQQSRAAKIASKEREAAIKETAAQTAERVTKSISAQYKVLIGNLNQQIGTLQQKLTEQGRDVSAIKQSNIVTGKKAVRVEVINQGLSGVSPSISAKPEIHVIPESTRKNETVHTQVIEWVVQNLGAAGTTAHITSTFLLNGVQRLGNNLPDRIDFGPQQSFTMSINIPESEAEPFLLGKEKMIVEIDIMYSSTSRDRLDSHYRHVAQYNFQDKSFSIMQSGLIDP